MTAAVTRHRWSEADHWATRRTCDACGMTKERFGTVSARNDVFVLDGRVIADTARGDRTPPCVPRANLDAGLRHVGERQSGDVRPDRAVCRYCKKVLEREPGATVWTAAQGPGLDGRNPQCLAAPNPDDGPMPDHEPDGVVIHPPAD